MTEKDNDSREERIKLHIEEYKKGIIDKETLEIILDGYKKVDEAKKLMEEILK